MITTMLSLLVLELLSIIFFFFYAFRIILVASREIIMELHNGKK